MNPTIRPNFRALIPPLAPEEFDRLEANILADGCKDSLVVWNGVLIDGHNRLAICQKNSLPFKVTEWEFKSEAEAELWILKNQLGRRNLTDDQRAMLADEAAELESKLVVKERAKQAVEVRELKAGRKKPIMEDTSASKIKPKERTRSAAAKRAGVSERRMKKARAVRKADPKLAEKVVAGEVTLAKAAATVAKAEKRNHVKTQEWPKGKYRVIYSDPPWQYGDARTGTQESGGVVAQYETMSLKDICALPVKDMATTDAVLFLWATSPLIPEAVAVIEAWGFKYKASFVWNKVRGFNGHYNDVQHELLLVATKGSCLPEIDTLPKSVITEEKSKHSAKPEAFRTLIDKLYPSGPRVELFARVKADGWAAWGNAV